MFGGVIDPSRLRCIKPVVVLLLAFLCSTSPLIGAGSFYGRAVTRIAEIRDSEVTLNPWLAPYEDGSFAVFWDASPEAPSQTRLSCDLLPLESSKFFGPALRPSLDLAQGELATIEIRASGINFWEALVHDRQQVIPDTSSREFGWRLPETNGSPPTISALGQRGFLVVWASPHFPGLTEVWGLRLGPRGAPYGNKFLLGTGSIDAAPVVATSNCSTVVVWQDANGIIAVRLGSDEIFAADFEDGNTLSWSQTLSPPLAAFSAFPKFGPAPLQVELDASASRDEGGTITSYAWNYGDGAQGSGVTSSHLYENPGEFDLTLVVTDNSGTTNQRTESIHVLEPNLPPLARFEVSRNNGHLPLIVEFDASYSTDPDGEVSEFIWDFGDGQSGSGVLASHTYTSSGTFTAVLTAVDNGGQISNFEIPIVVSPPNQLPSASISASASSGLAPISINFDASESTDFDGTLVRFDWNFSDGATATGPAVTYNFQSGGEHIVTLEVTDDDGAKATRSLRLDLHPTPTQFVESSPHDAEAGIAISRETILQFDGPLDPATISSASIFAFFGDQILNSRLHLSPDQKEVTLFYSAALPAASRIRVIIDGSLLRDIYGRPVDANRDGLDGGIEFIDFDTLALASIPGTKVCGKVHASELEGQNEIPLRDVEITVDGSNPLISTTTNASGEFCLDPAPAGRFFVHVDGRTSPRQVPFLSYYPFVGKTWDSRPGEQVDVGTVYLPLIPPGSLIPVSPTGPTRVGMTQEILDQYPFLNGVELAVPANSLFSDNGTFGGMVGIAPVNPDRLPGQLPEGLDFPIVITVQTDGATNFDRPVPVCFPNLPDALTGQKPEARAKSALWSFNHDTGAWEIKGSMTVSDDGRLICSDPGVGIEAPGWHGVQAGTQGEARPPVVPPPAPVPECEGPSLWDYADAVFDVASRGAACASGLFPVTRGAVCAVQALGTTGDLFNKTAMLILTLNRPNATRLDVVESAFAPIKAQKEQLVEFYDCASKAVPLPRLGAALDCLGVVSGLGEQACDLAGANSPRPECRPSPLIADTCAGVEAAAIALDQAAIVQDAIEAKADNWKITAACAGIDQIENLIGLFQADQRRSSQFLSPEERAQLLQELESLQNELEVFQDASESFPDLTQATTALEDLWASNSKKAGISSQTVGQAHRSILHYFLKVDEINLRGVTSTQGFFSSRLAPTTYYELREYDPIRKLLGTSHGRTGSNGQVTNLVVVPLSSTVGLADTDGDGLVDAAEEVVGTRIDDADSDNDGISDGAELEQGLNPLDNAPAITGIVRSIDTPGEALDVCAENGIAAIADSGAGLTVLETANGLQPIVLTQINTPGDAVAVACGKNRIAVADGVRGLAVINTSDPQASFIEHQISLGGTSRAVVVAADLAFVGMADGRIVVVDLPSGTLVDQLRLPGPVEDLAIGGDVLYAVVPGKLHVLSKIGEKLEMGASISFSGFASSVGRRVRLNLGGTIAYVTHSRGYSTFDVTDPLQPALISAGSNSQFGWKHLTLNGSGLAIAAVGTASTPDGPHHISLYDASDPQQVNAFVVEFPTPGTARSAAIWDGLAYVADGAAGLQILNFLPFDTESLPPSVELESSAGNVAEEGKILRLSAAVTDDVQVRKVEFFVDGMLEWVDGGYPFEYRFVTPLMSSQSHLVVKARAWDTGGNSTWSEETQIAIVPDSTPPTVEIVAPLDNSLTGQVLAVAAFFSEPMAPSSLVGSLSVIEAGPDSRFDTLDDLPINAVSEGWREEIQAFFLNFPHPVAPGYYRAKLSADATDLVGNHVISPPTWSFRVYDIGLDQDGDGLPDGLEPTLGLNPADPDSDDDGILDGQEDNDSDGLSNTQEVLLGTDPRDNDSNNNGINDADEDTDHDGLSNRQEFALLTDPRSADTDLDGFSDGDEVSSNTDPRSALSVPDLSLGRFVSTPPFAVLNQADPLWLEKRTVFPAHSTLNTTDPTGSDNQILLPLLSVGNQADPTGSDGTLWLLQSSIFNEVGPNVVVPIAVGSPVSVQNNVP